MSSEDATRAANGKRRRGVGVTIVYVLEPVSQEETDIRGEELKRLIIEAAILLGTSA